MLTFSAVRVLTVTIQTPHARPEYARLPAHQLANLYRATADNRQRQRIADAINAVHIPQGEDLLGWLVEEQEYQTLVEANVPYLAQDHRTWLRHVRAEIDALVAALDEC